MIWILAIIIALLVHTYVGYLLVLKWLRDWRGSQASIHAAHLGPFPKVSIVVSAYNEESVIHAKMANFAQLTYPQECLEILIGSDGSLDRTAEYLEQYKNIAKVHVFEQNRGKAKVLNELVALAQGEILVFCDMNTMFSPTAVEELVAGFDSPHVGAVNGRLVLLDSGKTVLGEGESFYWRIETEIKRLEADLGLLLGLNGAIYAIRKELYPVLPAHNKLTDDFYVCAKILQQGYHSRFAPLALGIESTSKDSLGEFKRKVRIGHANFNFLRSYLPLLHLGNPLLAFVFLSHKLLRWFSPFLLLLLLGLSLISAVLHPLEWSVWLLILAQVYFYGGALWVHRVGRISFLPLANLAYYFCSMNLALLIGFVHSLQKSEQGGAWERIERED